MIKTAPWKNRAASARKVARRAADFDSNYVAYADSLKSTTARNMHGVLFFKNQSINNIHVRVKSSPFKHDRPSFSSNRQTSLLVLHHNLLKSRLTHHRVETGLALRLQQGNKNKLADVNCGCRPRPCVECV